MRNALLLILLTALFIMPLYAQKDWEETNGMLYDFEGNVSNWWSFSCSANDGQVFAVVDNPDKSGINTSEKVGSFETTAACTWEGCGSSTQFYPFAFDAYPIVFAKVLAPDAGLSFMLKAENIADNTASPIEAYATTEVGGEWEELVFDFTSGAATGVDYERLIIFPDFGSTSETTIWYFDDIMFDGLQDTDVEPDVSMPSSALLTRNYPNPFNPQTTIEYELPEASMVELTVHDALGKTVQTLVSERQNSGLHQILFDSKDLASGVYYYKIQAAGEIVTHKMVLMK